MASGRLLAASSFALLVLMLVCRTCFTDASSLPSFWHQQLPNAAIPEDFEKLASPISASDAQSSLFKIKAGSSFQASMVSIQDFCSFAGIYCPEEEFVISVTGKQPRVCMPLFTYTYAEQLCNTTAATSVSAVQASAIFIPQQALMAGMRVQIPDTANDLQGLKFLPSSIADALPKLESGSFPELARFYGVQKGSDMELEMKNTLAHCELKSEQEVKACQALGEGVVSFVSGTVGPNAVALSAPVVAKQEATIMDIAIVSRLGEKVASCHNMKFPSLVYSCHMTQTAELMDVSLQLANGELARIPVVCHMDTSYWNPSHVAFQALDVQPGKSSVCHWFLQNSFIFA